MTQTGSLPFDSMPTNDVQSALEPYSCQNPAPFFCDEELTAAIAAANEEMRFTSRLALLDKLAQRVHDTAACDLLDRTIRFVRGLARREWLCRYRPHSRL
jgi:hypothetical protein